MAVQSGHEDLKKKEVFGFDGVSGNIFVDGGEKGLLRYQLFVLPGGQLRAEPIKEEGVDQQGERRKPTKADRMRGIDQQ